MKTPGRLTLLRMLDAGQYDPVKLGARCDLCSLKKNRAGGPVPPEIKTESELSLIGESPSSDDCIDRRPLIGSAGMELNNALNTVGATRGEWNLHLALACMPPGGDLDRVMLQWQRANQARVKNGEDEVPSPIECCRPRLMVELGHPKGIVTLGKVALTSLTRKSKSIMEIRGGPVDGWVNTKGDWIDGAPPDDAENVAFSSHLMPTLHPGFVQKVGRWRHAFKIDLSKAARWFRTGTIGWQEPEITINPSPLDLEEFLARTDINYSVDVETTVDDPTVADLRTVGIGHEYKAMVCVLKSIETGQSAYNSTDDAEIRRILTHFFADVERLKFGHNFGYFDRMVIKNHFGVDPKPVLDTILMHRSVEPELPHRLAYVGSIYTDVTSWKEAHTATEARTDEELARYNGIDCVVTARVLPKLADLVENRAQTGVVRRDHAVQSMCVGLHENGMFVDRELRDVVAKDLIGRMAQLRREAQSISGRPDLNPNSVYQLRDLLFKEWKLQPVDYTLLGDPSTNDECIRVMRSANREEPQKVAFFDTLRKYRKVAKEYGAFVRRMVPYGMPLDRNSGFQSEEEQEESERGLIMADGRMRPDYSAHGTVTGRLSSSNPNAQTYPKHLRKLIIPEPGHVIIGADADQLELRIITSIAQIKVYLDAFSNKQDPHAMTASLMFGPKFDELVPKSDLWDKMRKIAKGIKYASFYGSGDKTVFDLVTSAEDDNGNLMYPDLSLKQVATLRRNWLKGVPELPKWWEDTQDEFRASGCIRDPLWFRQRDFLDGENFNEIVNFAAQSSGAHIIHESTFDLLNVMPFCKWGRGTGLISQVHDALYAEVPCDHDRYIGKDAEFGWCPPGCKCVANGAARDIEAAMNRTIIALPGVTFSAKAKIGKNWGEV